MNRREMIGKTAASVALSATVLPFQESRAAEPASGGLKGNIHHSVSQWCYGDIPLTDLAKACKEMGNRIDRAAPGEKIGRQFSHRGSNVQSDMQPIGVFPKDSTGSRTTISWWPISGR